MNVRITAGCPGQSRGYVNESPPMCMRELNDQGYTVVSGVFHEGEIDSLVVELERALSGSCGAVLRTQTDVLYAARNLLQVWPRAQSLWRRSPLEWLLHQTLGPRFGMVRGLFFDKPPQQTWALPWHKDMTIAVREHRQPMGRFGKPTRKAGVPHVEAPLELLEAMLTLRIHFDEVTETNGPLRVLPGSHRTGKLLNVDESLRRNILVQKGDVLVIRPLVAHSSAASHPDNRSHRRVVHLEFAAWPELPGGFAWHTFIGC